MHHVGKYHCQFSLLSSILVSTIILISLGITQTHQPIISIRLFLLPPRRSLSVKQDTDRRYSNSPELN